jgi:hypothetical protein
MSVKDLLRAGKDFTVLASGKVSIATATTTNVDFGTPDDINLASITGYQPGDRIVAIFTATTAGTTDTTDFVVQDAPDSSGSIGTPATATTDGSLAGGTGNQVAVVGVKVKAGRPWLRFAAHRAAGTTDTTVVTCVVVAIRRSHV